VWLTVRQSLTALQRRQSRAFASQPWHIRASLTCKLGKLKASLLQLRFIEWVATEGRPYSSNTGAMIIVDATLLFVAGSLVKNAHLRPERLKLVYAGNASSWFSLVTPGLS
jgi:hypothetical protein